jgi:hypothetical protein
MRDLSTYSFNTYSHSGEDGIIKEIFQRLENSAVNLDKWCCEFGAWDGIHLSNTARLIKEQEYKAVLIEGDPRRLKDLKKNFPNDNVTKICSFIEPTGPMTIDNLLKNTKIPTNFDFLSIDIDGMDYYIFESMKIYKPKLICIEINPTIPNKLHFVQERDSSVKQGASALAVCELANTKGYVLVAASQCNLFLIEKALLQYVLPTETDLDKLFPAGLDVQYIFSGYDGTILSNKPNITLGWHGSFPLQSWQLLPRFLRRYSGDYSALQRFGFLAFSRIKRLSYPSLRRRIRGLFRAKQSHIS